MESSAMRAAVEVSCSRANRVAADNAREIAARSSRHPGMGFGHDVLLALIMAVVMAATAYLCAMRVH